MADAWCEFRDSSTLEVAIFTGTGRAFCAGEDMKESVERGVAGSQSAARQEGKPVRSGHARQAGHRGDQWLCDGGRLHAGRTRGSEDRRPRRDSGVLRSEALAPRRVRSRYQRPPAARPCDGNGVHVQIHRRALVRRGLHQSRRRARAVDAHGARDGRAPAHAAARLPGEHDGHDAAIRPRLPKSWKISRGG